MKKGHIAIDLGASSGRLILSTLANGKIVLEEIHRFTNDPVYVGKRFYWDFLRIFHEIKEGLKKAGRREDVTITTIGIDTWGVDGGWLDKEGQLLTYPAHYRDTRTEDIMGDFYAHLSDDELYQTTGIQKISFNTIYQLYYDYTKNPVVQNFAEKWLFIPDLLNYLLTGVIKNEYTIASTGAVLDANEKDYAKTLFEKLDLPHSKMGEMIQPGQVLGYLKEEIAKEVGLNDVAVIAVGSHDTASAVAATPLMSENEAYLCCGTWCLMGMELDSPCITEATRTYNFTNEGGVEGTIRFLKNINGLWFLQQLRKNWQDKGMNLSFPQIIEEVKQSQADYAVDAADNRFMAPFSMLEEIVAYCKETYGVTLTSVGDIAKAAYNGLGNLYQKVIMELEEVTGKNIEVIHMVGGGIQDTYLCQKVADVTQKKVIAGPIEASCIGNVLMQLKAVGEIESLAEGRALVAQSFEQHVYLPR
jgi:rhamnulokinase